MFAPFLPDNIKISHYKARFLIRTFNNQMQFIEFQVEKKTKELLQFPINLQNPGNGKSNSCPHPETTNFQTPESPKVFFQEKNVARCRLKYEIKWNSKQKVKNY